MAQLRSRIDTGEGDQREPEALEIKQLVNPQRSSGGEHCLHTAGVAGSNPAAPTIFLSYAVQRQEVQACKRSTTEPSKTGLPKNRVRP